MENEKLISAIRTIERALGIIEGVASALENSPATALIDAIDTIDAAVKEITDGE